MSSESDIETRVDETRDELLRAVATGEPLVVVKAPPGSGKTRLVLEVAAFLRSRGERIAIAAQTNSQADDICERLDREFPFDVVRFCSASNPIRPHLGGQVTWESSGTALPAGASIVVGTAAKWGFASPNPPFDWLLIDEAWQLSYANFMLLEQISPRFVMVGDPGQIAPVVTIDTSRWATSDVPPHVATPELLLGADGTNPVKLELPATYRLPQDSAEAVREFYDFDFESVAKPGDRKIEFGEGGEPSALDPLLELLTDGSIAVATLATPPEGPPLEEDSELAELASQLVVRMLERGATLSIDGDEKTLEVEDIGMCASHRRMNSRMAEALPDGLAGGVNVDTAERWQGLERPLMLVVHPISGSTDPTTFDLQTERLCVMASRHKVGLVIVARDHVPKTLEELIPTAEQHVGLPDVAGSGLSRQRAFWHDLETRKRILPVEMETEHLQRQSAQEAAARK